MALPKILVTAATGKTGTAVVEQLREKGFPVRALVRSHDARSERLERLGVEIAVGDLFDHGHLLSALRGTRRAYYCPPMHPHALQSAVAFALAAREAGVESIVGMSQWLASPEHPSTLTRQHWLADRVFSMVPEVAYTIVNPGYFADNYLRLLDFAAFLGVFPVLTGTSLNAPPSNEDIARVAVAILADSNPHAGKSYRPTGPALLSAFDMAAVIEKVLERRVRPIAMPMWMFVRAARLQGETAFTLAHLAHYVRDHVEGAFAYSAPSDHVLATTGHPAEDFEATTRRYAALPFVQPTLANRMRVLVNFGLVPFVPGYDLAGNDRRLSIPAPNVPTYAMESTEWRRERAARPTADSDAITFPQPVAV